MTYMQYKALEMKKPGDPDLYAPGQPCIHKCNEECSGIGCKDCKQVRGDCTQCVKNKPHELLKTAMVGEPSIVFHQYTEVRVPQIISHKYREPMTCARVVRFNANSPYLYCSGQEMPW